MAMTYEEAKKEAENQKYSATGSTEGVDEAYIQSLMTGDTAAYSNNALNGGQTAGGDTSEGSGGSSGSSGSSNSKEKRSGGGSGGSDSLINSIYGNAYTAQERQLKAALDDMLDQLDRQKGVTYANQMTANKNSNEAMLNQGINSGAIAQSALSSNNALQGNLGAIGEAETEAYKDYGNNVAALKAQLESDKMNALLNDYYNQQQFDYQAGRDTVSDQQYAQNLALQQQQYGDSQAYQAKSDKQEWAYNMWQLLGYATQEISNILGVAKGTKYPVAGGSSSGGSSGGSGGSSGGSGGKPTLTAAQTLAAINAGTLTEPVLSAYEYYYGEPYKLSDESGGQEEAAPGSVGDYTPGNSDNIGWLENRIQYFVRLSHTQPQMAAEALKYIQAWRAEGKITEDQADALVAKYGLAG